MLRRWTLVWFVLTLTLSSANLLAPAPAAAEPVITATCYGASCNGLDPYAAGCVQDSYIVARDEYYYLTRRYSPSCNAFWAEASGGYTYTFVEGWMEDNYSATYRSWYSGVTTAMWASGRACMYAYGGGFYAACA